MKKISLWLSIVILCVLSIGSISAAERGGAGKIQKITEYKTFIKSESQALSIDVEIVGDKQMILQTRKEMIEKEMAVYNEKRKLLDIDIVASNYGFAEIDALAEKHNNSKPNSFDSLGVAAYNYEAEKLSGKLATLIGNKKTIEGHIKDLEVMKTAILESKESFNRSYEKLMDESKAFDARSEKFLSVSKEFTAFMIKNCPSLLQNKKTQDDALSLGCRAYVTGK